MLLYTSYDELKKRIFVARMVFWPWLIFYSFPALLLLLVSGAKILFSQKIGVDMISNLYEKLEIVRLLWSYSPGPDSKFFIAEFNQGMLFLVLSFFSCAIPGFFLTQLKREKRTIQIQKRDRDIQREVDDAGE